MRSPDHALVIPSRAELFLGFFKTGLSGFGGVLPHARRMLVDDRRWLSDQEFTDLLGLGQCLPGPNVVNIAVVVGSRFHGWAGSLIALCGMMLAPLIVVLALATIYGHFSDSHVLQQMLSGIAAGGAGLMLATGARLATGMQPRGWAVAILLVAFLAVLWPRLPLLWVLLVLAPVAIGCGWWSVKRELAREMKA